MQSALPFNQAQQIRPGILYYPRFLGEPDDTLADVLEQVEFTQRSRRMYGREVATPRLEAWHGDHPYRFGGSELPARPLPASLLSLAIRAEAVLRDAQIDARFDSCLANLYRNGLDSVGWHADDEPEMGDPIIASISLGAERDFLLRPKPSVESSSSADDPRDGEAIKIKLEHGSMLVMLRGVQAAWEHCLPRVRANAGQRINLTFRDCR